MKTITSILTMCLISFLFIFQVEAGTFISGSTGADGPFNPPAQVPAGTVVDGNTVTVPLPANGIFNFTTANIATGITVKFQRNAANTPAYILTTGDVTIVGTIDVSGQTGASGNSGAIAPVAGGKGGPGGFDGGYGGQPGSTGGMAAAPAGNGLGPGGGPAGTSNCPRTASGWFDGSGGGFANQGQGWCVFFNVNNGGNPYGTPSLIPLIGGSGGGGGFYGSTYTNFGAGGGGGGGAILIASSTKINITGSLLANGGSSGSCANSYCGGGGSGGAIRLMSNEINGTGSVQVAGAGSVRGTGGSSGRIRLEGNVITLQLSNPSVATPGLVFLPQVPNLEITMIAGNTVSASASGSYAIPDMTLPSSTTNPVSVAITAMNIPVGTTVTIHSIPQHGSPSSVTTTLTGTDASSTATANVNISTTYPTIINAETTFTVQTAMYFDGEKLNKIRVASVMGKESQVTYISESGKEIPAARILASLK